MQNLNLSALVPRTHAIMVANEFWTPAPDPGLQLMRAVTELGEVFDADRLDKRADLPTFFAAWKTQEEQAPEPLEIAYGALFSAPGSVKNTLDDELADVAIVLLDFIGGYHLNVGNIGTYRHLWHRMLESMPLPANLAHALLKVSATITAIDHPLLSVQEWHLAHALAQLELLAARLGVELPSQVELKLRYNAGRAARHGKKY